MDRAPEDATDVTEGKSWRTIASFTSYLDAQSVVDRLADDHFPVDQLTIVGRDLRYVERIRGRLTPVTAALGGLAFGAVFGGLFGLLFGALFATDGLTMLAILLNWVVVAAIAGALFALLSYALIGQDRSFVSTPGWVAAHYDVLAAEPVADEALRRLGLTAARRPADPDRVPTI